MARPTSISNEEILQGARQLFLERGHAVPTAEIARHLGISEGSIFKRFATKDELFLAAMGLPSSASWSEDLPELAGQGELKENMVQIALELLGFVRELLPRLMLVWACRGHEAHLQSLREAESPPKRGLRALARYFGQEMTLGRLQQGDPELMARIFFGSIWNLAFMETIGQIPLPLSAESYARQLVETLWRGLAPEEQDQGALKLGEKE